MTLSIVIVSWNVREFLRNCLYSLYTEVRLAPAEWELLIVDNHSHDGTAEMVHRDYPHARLIINEENVGFGAANNQGLPQTSGKYLLLLNPDTVVRGQAVDTMVARMEASADVAAIGCRLLNSDGTFQAYSQGAEPTIANLAMHYLFLNRLLPRTLCVRGLYVGTDPQKETAVGWVSGACLLLRRTALSEQIFDERFFMYCEDVELCSRLARAGWRVIYTPAAEVTHHEGQSIHSAGHDVELHKVASLRKFVSMRHGRTGLVACDAVMVLGFLLRTGALTIGALTHPSAELAARRGRTYRFLREAVRSFGTAGER